jgi:hypothetical protein
MTTDVDHLAELDDPNDPDSDYGRGYQAALDAERHPVTTPDQPDLCALAAFAAGDVRVDTPEEIADAVLAAVLPAHRDMVLEEAAQHLAACRRCGREHQARPVSGTRVSWADPDDGHAYDRTFSGAAALRRLAATTPADGPASTETAENAPAVGREVPQAEAVPLETLVEELGATDPVFRAAAERTALIERLAEGHWRLDWPHQGYGWADENRPTAEAHRRGARRCLDAIALAGLRLVPAGVPGPQLADRSRVTRERDLLKAELEIGRQVQRSLMDEVLRCVADLRIAAARVAELEAAAADREQGGIERAEQANG